MNETEKTHQYVIRGDEVFRQDTFETKIDTMDKLMSEAFEPKRYNFIPMMMPPMLQKMVYGHTFGTTPSQEQLLCYTEIYHFPFHGACLKRHPNTRTSRKERGYGEDEHFNYVDDDTWVLDTEYIDSHTQNREKNGILSPKNLVWDIPEGFRAFLLMPMSLSKQELTHPYLCFTDMDMNNPRIPKLTNIMDSGVVCTGSSFLELNNGGKEPMELIRAGLNCVRTAPMNDHQRQNDTEFVQFNSKGESLPTKMKHDHFHGIISDERLIEYLLWAKEAML
jgi:hypothetical protein